MKNVFQSPKPLLVAGLLGFALVASAWQLHEKKSKNPSAQSNSSDCDTSQPGQRYDDTAAFNMNGFNENMLQLDKQMQMLDVQMKNINYQKIVDDALSKVDFKEIGEEVNNAMKNIDWKEIQENVDRSVKNINWNEIQANIDKSLQEAKEEMAKVDMEKVNEQMKELQKKFNSDEFRAQFDSEKIQKEIEEGMQKAKEGMAKAKLEMQNWKDFSDALQKDGLIDKSKPYTIQLKDGDLYINGTKQSKETTGRYNKYYEGKKDFSINMNGENDEDNDNNN